jgi:hypothetical protein
MTLTSGCHPTVLIPNHETLISDKDFVLEASFGRMGLFYTSRLDMSHRRCPTPHNNCAVIVTGLQTKQKILLTIGHTTVFTGRNLNFII